MGNPLYNQLNGNTPVNPLFNRIKLFRDTFTGNPQQAVQNLINTGRITQAQVNQYAQQADQIYKMLK